MPKKRKVTRKNKAEDLTKEITEEKYLEKQIKELTEGLFYISETDAEVFPFIGEKAEAVTSDEILRQTRNEANANIEEREFKEFFERLTKFQDWFEEEERSISQKFRDLENLLEVNLRDLKVFKIGQIEIDIYAVGLDKEDKLIGIQTKAVET